MPIKTNKKVFPLFLWLLKAGALSNLFFLVQTFRQPLISAAPQALLPARILFLVSAYRCLFPVRYKDQVVFHDSPLSSIFATRFLATFSEIALVYQLSFVLRTANLSHLILVDVLSWVMVIQVILSQIFVWGSILTGKRMLFFYEEIGWFLIYLINTAASLFLYATSEIAENLAPLLLLNILFGIFYLPWQFFRLRSLYKSAGEQTAKYPLTVPLLLAGLKRSIHIKNPTVDPDAWGGLMGLTWMAAYWAAVIPVWAYLILLKI